MTRKLRSIACFGGLLFLGAAGAHAEDGWLIVVDRFHFSLVRAQGDAIREVAILKSAAPVYSDTAEVVGAISLAEGMLKLVDKKSGALSLYKISYTPTEDLGGPRRDLVITQDAAWFIAHLDVSRQARDSGGGGYNLVGVSLPSGEERALRLPQDCVGPHLVMGPTGPLVYSRASNGKYAWTLDAAGKKLVPTVWNGATEAGAQNLPQSAASGSAYSGPGGTVYYVDQESHSINRLSPKGVSEKVWQLSTERSAQFARIIAVEKTSAAR